VAGFVLTDASLLIGLVRVDGLAWLRELFGEVWVPQEVWREVIEPDGVTGRDALQEAERSGVLKIWPSPAPTTPTLPDLDDGELACIRIGLGQSGSVLLLMDERAGRALALEHGLQVAGTAAVIGMAKKKGLIPSAKAVFATLHASDFRISRAVITTVLAKVGESG
jgi:predicted nucleic acid-binding protein